MSKLGLQPRAAIVAVALVGLALAAGVALSGSVRVAYASTVFYVAQSGDDGNNCTSAGTPCGTIQHAIDLAAGVSGDVVIDLAAGVYTADTGPLVDVPNSATYSSLKIVGASPSEITGTGTGTGVVVVGNVPTEIDNVLISEAQGGNAAIETTGTAPNLTLVDDDIHDNDAGTGAVGGIDQNVSGGTLVVKDSLFNGNSGVQTGAIASAGSLTLENDTFYDNSSAGDDAVTALAGSASITGSTFAGNDGTAADVLGGASSMTIADTLLAENNGAANCGGTESDGGNNMEDGTSCGFSPGESSIDTSNLFATGSPSDNGGQTSTIALADGSPAIGAGDSCPATDQRGVPRPGSACDVGAYEYTDLAAPTVTGIAPVGGRASGGDTVTISGSGFESFSNSADHPKFGGLSASSYVVNGDSSITAVAPAGTGTVDVTVAGSATSTADEYTYDATPTVSDVSPSGGRAAGGDTVTVTGNGFLTATGVTVDGTSGSNLHVNSDTSLTFSTPPGTASGTPVHVIVTNSSGSSTGDSNSEFTYDTVPTVVSVSPAFAPAAGGQTVTIQGSSFETVSAVKFGSTDAASFSIDSDNQITATAPADLAGGSVDITVTNGSGTSATSGSDVFVYDATPTVTNISPNAGGVAGGTGITITGTGFLDVSGSSGVQVDGIDATSYSVVSDTQITAQTPAGTSGGAAHVTVTNETGTSSTSSNDIFTYDDTPTVTSLSPVADGIAGNTSVTIHGTGFLDVTGPTGVKFGATNASSYSVVSDTQIDATSPSSGTAGAVDVRVKNETGTSPVDGNDSFTYDTVPTVTSVAPGAGKTAGSDTVTVTGTGFLTATGVTIGGASGTSLHINSDTELTISSPSGTATGNPVHILVVNTSGTSAGTNADAFVYDDVPTVTGISPASGKATGGDVVTVTGTGFLTATGVAFGGTNGTSLHVVSDTSLTIHTPPGTATGNPVDLVVTNSSGSSATSGADGFTYDTVPTVASVSPGDGTSGGGDSVTVTGTGFASATSVSFGAAAASSFTVDSDTQITATSPTHAGGAVHVTVTNSTSTSTGTSNDLFIYDDVPTVTSITPSSGRVAGGTSVTITGTGFLDVSGAAGVEFGSNDAASYSVSSDTQIVATTPHGSGGPIDVTVTDRSGTSATSGSDVFTYDALPSVTSISPSAGSTAGGATVTIAGTNFSDVSGSDGVQFGGVDATNYSVVSDAEITATLPAESAGAVDVTVTNESGTSATSGSDVYTYDAAPTVSSVAPSAGKAIGGAVVTVTGTGFLSATGVTFGGVAGTSLSIASDGSLTVHAPPGAASSTPVDVVVTNAASSSAVVAADQFTYDSTPTVTAVAPIAGMAGGGTLVAVTGTGFLTTTGVKFGGASGTSVNVISDTSLTVTAPAHAASSTPVDVVVTNTTGSSATSSADDFTYDTNPTVTSLSPSSGKAAGGATVTVHGTGFYDTTGVTFGGTAATSFTVDSDSQLTVTVPAGTPSTTPVDIVVTNNTGPSTTSPADHFTYDGTPTVSAVAPGAGRAAGGTSVTVTGTGFLTATGVTFGGTAGTSLSITSDTSLTVTAPAGTASATPVDVVVANTTGSSTTTSADDFTYDTTPTVTAVSPVAGKAVGAATITVTGTGFLSATGVTFGGVAGTALNVTSDTSLTVTDPSGTASTTPVQVVVTNTSGSSTATSADDFTYDTTPTLTALSLHAGRAAGGTIVTVTGSGFLTATGVTFGGAAGTALSVTSDTSLTVTAPSGTASATPVDVVVTNTTGSSATSGADHFTYDTTPTVTSVAPASGALAGGATVTIHGTGLADTTGVDFGANAATSVTVVSDTQVTATAPAQVSSGPVDVTVTNTTGTSTTGAPDRFTYDDVPTVSAVSPQAGKSLGGTVVTVTGTGFLTATGVTFGGTAGTGLNVLSDTSLTVTAPAHAASSTPVDVVVANASGSSSATAADHFTYDTTPSVTSLSQTFGPLAGGTSVTVHGTGFSDTTSVKFGAVNASSYTIDSDTQITATSPAQVSGGVVDVTVANTTATSTTGSGDHFTYDAAPTVTNVAPNAGEAAGGTTVTLTGTGFLTATGVTFDGAPGTALNVTSDTTLTVAAPSGTASATPVDVVVTNSTGSSPTNANDHFTYDGTPTVASVSPAAGRAAGGTSVTVTGTGFLTATAVTFAGVSGTSLNVTSDTSLTVTAPSGTASPTPVDVVVTNSTGLSSATSGDHFTYDGAPAITSVSPVAGSTAGGTSVTITGTGFLTATAVAFGATAATSYSVDSDTEITATSPGESAGAVDVRVTNPTATSATSANDRFTFDTAPTVTHVAPSSGSTNGGATVTITGTGFLGVSGAGGVQFGGVDATGYSVDSDTQITATSPSGSAGTVDVTVTSSNGTSSTGAADHYTYDGTPTVGAVSPGAGKAAGGTVVTVTGTGFLTATGVTFGGVAGTSLSVVSDTSLTVAAPAGTASATPVDVVVTNATDTSAPTSSDHFTYDTTPTVASVSPGAGKAAGGTSVTVTGTGFLSATGVTFGGVAGTAVNVTSDTTLTVTAPAKSASTTPVDVVVTNTTGSSSATAADHFTFDTTPTVTSVSPSAGMAAGGDTVTVTGTGFLTATAVTFSGVVGSSLNVTSDTTLTVTAPSGTASVTPVDIVVTNSTGSSSATAADHFTYDTTPTVTSISPAFGPLAGGTSVTIHGTGFLTASGVHFGANAATSFTVNSDTQITASSPSQVSGGSVDVTVTNTTSTSTTGAPDRFTYDATPTVGSISPGVGGAAGGKIVTVTGTGFLTATGVHFGATSATSFSVVSDTQLTATAPAHAVGVVDLTVTNPAGTSTTGAGDQFTYETAATVSAVAPQSGATAGGTSVTITGTGFLDAASVTFGGAAATGYSIDSATQITATAPAHTSANVDIVVTNSVGSSSTSTADTFTYGVPAVTSLTPTAGGAAGGASVTITGSRFLHATGVLFGGTSATFTVVSDSQITATAPAGSAGVVDVTVANSAGASAASPADDFTYDVAPTVSATSPAFGTTGGGTTVTVTGTGFLTATGVHFGATSATSFSVVSDTQLTATAPAHAGGTVDVTVTNSSATSPTSGADQFTYESAATVSAVSPQSGATAGGTSVTITGTGFLDVAGAGGVRFGVTAATGYTVDSATQITATAPAHAAGNVDIVVTNSVGSSSTSTADTFTYGAPAVASVAPGSGATAGGTSVTITGSRFLHATGVSFGGTSATFTAVSDSQITATAPAGSTGVVDVTVANDAGTSTTSPADLFTYGAPVVTSLSPSDDVSAGGTTVTVTGSNFTNATSVSFGATAATGFTVDSDTQITATTPAGSTGTVDLTVGNGAGTSATGAGDQWTYDITPTSIAVATGTAYVGNAATVTATITPAPDGGTVAFSADGTPIVGCDLAPVTAGEAQCTFTPAATGTIAITADYSGNADYQASTTAVSSDEVVDDAPPPPAGGSNSSSLPTPAAPDGGTSRSILSDEAGTLSLTAGDGSAMSPPVLITVSWQADSIEAPATVVIAPSSAPAQRGLHAGSSVASIVVRDSSGDAIHSFSSPVTVTFDNVPPGFMPTTSEDGVTWQRIPRLGGSTLPDGQPDGYTRSGERVTVLTRHASFYGVQKELPANVTRARATLLRDRRALSVTLETEQVTHVELTLYDADDHALKAWHRWFLKPGTQHLVLWVGKGVVREHPVALTLEALSANGLQEDALRRVVLAN